MRRARRASTRPRVQTTHLTILTKRPSRILQRQRQRNPSLPRTVLTATSADAPCPRLARRRRVLLSNVPVAHASASALPFLFRFFYWPLRAFNSSHRASDDTSDIASSRISENSSISFCVKIKLASTREKLLLGFASSTLNFTKLPGFAFEGALATI